MALPHRRPRTIDTTAYCCPQTTCDDRGWLGRGHLHAKGHPSGGLWRQFPCVGCNGYFVETHGPSFPSKRTNVERIGHGLACWAEGLGIRATARVFAVDPHTVLQWLGEAAEQLQALSAYSLCALPIQQVQLDAL